MYIVIREARRCSPGVNHDALLHTLQLNLCVSTMEQRKKIEDVWFEYRSGIKAFLHTRVSAAEEVDDLLQEILIKTHKSLPVLKSEKNKPK